MIVVADTSGLLAAMDRDHPHGAAARQVLRDAGSVVVPPAILGELDHVGRRVFGARAASRAIDHIASWAARGRVLLSDLPPEDLATAQRVRSRHRALDLDLADAVVVVAAARFLTDAVLTFDRRHFRAIRPLTPHECFHLLRDDR
ncbi:MAG: PIN domain-containing protein [Dermatophilaceae bacterium]